jgi:aminomethyltransferase
VFQAAEWDGWLVARTGYTGEDGFEIALPAAGRKTRTWLATDWTPASSPGRPGRARHPAAGSRHEPLRPGHGRGNVTPATKPAWRWTVDMKDAAPRLHRKVKRMVTAQQARAQPVPGPAAARSRRAAQPTRRSSRRWARAKPPAAASRPALNQSIALARVLPSRHRPRQTRSTSKSATSSLKARVVKPVFVRNGNPLI